DPLMPPFCSIAQRKDSCSAVKRSVVLTSTAQKIATVFPTRSGVIFIFLKPIKSDAPLGPTPYLNFWPFLRVTIPRGFFQRRTPRLDNSFIILLVKFVASIPIFHDSFFKIYHTFRLHKYKPV